MRTSWSVCGSTEAAPVVVAPPHRPLSHSKPTRLAWMCYRRCQLAASEGPEALLTFKRVHELFKNVDVTDSCAMRTAVAGYAGIVYVSLEDPRATKKFKKHHKHFSSINSILCAVGQPSTGGNV